MVWQERIISAIRCNDALPVTLSLANLAGVRDNGKELSLHSGELVTVSTIGLFNLRRTFALLAFSCEVVSELVTKSIDPLFALQHCENVSGPRSAVGIFLQHTVDQTPQKRRVPVWQLRMPSVENELLHFVAPAGATCVKGDV